MRAWVSIPCGVTTAMSMAVKMKVGVGYMDAWDSLPGVVWRGR